MEVGFLAAGYGFHKQAETIFRGLQGARPDSESPLIGLAFTYLSSNRPQQAAEVLEQQALKLNPDSDLAKVYLGWAHKNTGAASRAEALLREVVSSDSNPAATALAKGFLNE